MVNLIFNRFKDWWTSEKTCKALEAVNRDDFETHKAAWDAGKDCQILDLMEDLQPGCGCPACVTIKRVKDWMDHRDRMSREVGSSNSESAEPYKPEVTESRRKDVEKFISEHDEFVSDMKALEEAQNLREEALHFRDEALREGVESENLRDRVDTLEKENKRLRDLLVRAASKALEEQKNTQEYIRELLDHT